MADTKISNLPAVAVPAGGDEFACHQGGVTKKETKTQITAATDAALAADVAALAAHIATTTAPIHGSSTAAGANTLAHRNAAGDVAATDFNAVAGTAANPSHTFTADPDTGLYRFAANELGIATLGTHRAHWNTTGAVILNDALASSKMTGPGVTIQQGAKDDEAVAVQSTDVAHGITDFADTDTYFQLLKEEAVAGGALLRGYKDADGIAGAAGVVNGILGQNADTTKTVNARAIVEIVGFIKSGTGIGDTNADGNVFAVLTRRGGATVTLLIVDEDADLHVLNDIVVAGVVDGVDVAAHAAATAAGTHGSSVAAAVNTLVHRDAAGRSQIVAPNVAADISNKAYVDAQTHIGGYGAPITPAGITDRTRKFFIPCIGGTNDDPADLLAGIDIKGVLLSDNAVSNGRGIGIVPSDFVSDITLTAVVIAGANGNVFSRHWISYGACGEGYATHTADTGYAAVAVTDGTNQNCIQQLALANAAIGDIIRTTYTRDGDHLQDTVVADCWLAGWIVEYTSDS